MRRQVLTTVLRWLVVIVILRVGVLILASYGDYFPPNFASLFLQGREATFHGLYRVAFYTHILTGPLVLFNGLFLLSATVRQRYGSVHRYLGRAQVIVLLLFVLPSSFVMARLAFAGWPAGLSFMLLTLTTGTCAVLGTHHAWQQRYDVHQRWMSRCYVLLCSAVVLRLASGAASVLDVTDEETAYIVAAWCSWLVPLGLHEIVRGWWPQNVQPHQHRNS